MTSNISLTSACSSHISTKQLSSGQRSGEFIWKYGRSSRQRPHMRLESYACLHKIIRNINGGALLHCFVSMKSQTKKCFFQIYVHFISYAYKLCVKCMLLIANSNSHSTVYYTSHVKLQLQHCNCSHCFVLNSVSKAYSLWWLGVK